MTGQRVALVESERLMPTDGEGEIWVAGPHVTDGYLSGDSSELFGELDGTRYLRTGDLGRLRDGELVPTGRAKDVIVFRGVNYHAADVEAAALEAAGRTGRTAAAFLLESGPDPVPVLVLEVRGQPDEAFAAHIRAAVLAHTGLRLGLVALARPRAVPRTSSGKVRRSACRDAFAAGTFDGAVCSGDAGVTGASPARGGAAADSRRGPRQGRRHRGADRADRRDHRGGLRYRRVPAGRHVRRPGHGLGPRRRGRGRPREQHRPHGAAGGAAEHGNAAPGR